MEWMDFGEAAAERGKRENSQVCLALHMCESHGRNTQACKRKSKLCMLLRLLAAFATLGGGVLS